jgi:hypothetical protein
MALKAHISSGTTCGVSTFRDGINQAIRTPRVEFCTSPRPPTAFKSEMYFGDGGLPSDPWPWKFCRSLRWMVSGKENWSSVPRVNIKSARRPYFIAAGCMAIGTAMFSRLWPICRRQSSRDRSRNRRTKSRTLHSFRRGSQRILCDGSMRQVDGADTRVLGGQS